MVGLVPSTPMKDDRLSTSRSFKMICASCCCRADIAANEIFCGASEIPRITPVSCTGKNPFGTITYRKSVSTSVAAVTSKVAVRSEEHTSELQSHVNLVCRLLLEKKKRKQRPWPASTSTSSPTSTTCSASTAI